MNNNQMGLGRGVNQGNLNLGPGMVTGIVEFAPGQQAGLGMPLGRGAPGGMGGALGGMGGAPGGMGGAPGGMGGAPFGMGGAHGGMGPAGGYGMMGPGGIGGAPGGMGGAPGGMGPAGGRGIMGPGGMGGGPGGMGGAGGRGMIGGYGGMGPTNGIVPVGGMGPAGGMGGHGNIGGYGGVGSGGGMGPGGMGVGGMNGGFGGTGIMGRGGIAQPMGTGIGVVNNQMAPGYGSPNQPAPNQGFQQISPQSGPSLSSYFIPTSQSELDLQSYNNPNPQSGPGSQSSNNSISIPPQYAPAPFINPNPPAQVYNKVIPDMDWQFLDDAGQYKFYDKVLSRQIENFYQNNAPWAEVMIDGSCYIINFKPPFSQYSKAGKGVEREVRRNDGSAPPRLETTDAVWMWQQDNGQFCNYEPKACLMIERAFRNGNTHLIVWGTSGKAYFIDLADKSNIFQKNEITQYIRKVIRK